MTRSITIITLTCVSMDRLNTGALHEYGLEVHCKCSWCWWKHRKLSSRMLYPYVAKIDRRIDEWTQTYRPVCACNRTMMYCAFPPSPYYMKLQVECILQGIDRTRTGSTIIGCCVWLSFGSHTTNRGPIELDGFALSLHLFPLIITRSSPPYTANVS